jgi:putative membrane protein
MTSAFKNGSFTDGVIDAVRAVGAILKEHVPRRPDDTNELPDTVRVR